MNSGNPVHIRWKGHERYVRKSIAFKPGYAELIDRLSKERCLCQREVIEEALRQVYGNPETGSDKGDSGSGDGVGEG